MLATVVNPLFIVPPDDDPDRNGNQHPQAAGQAGEDCKAVQADEDDRSKIISYSDREQRWEINDVEDQEHADGTCSKDRQHKLEHGPDANVSSHALYMRGV
ncbi:hypothetical protein ACIPY5_15030 [Microbacterium sp. NPDC089698]|uniref:hypothetical protein n=1 Tax=Microbacterium sp. NPDC089698 TaxID=3364200 RepID=UPI00380E33B0